MAKQLLKERFQQLAGIKPLYELDESAEIDAASNAWDFTLGKIKDNDKALEYAAKHFGVSKDKLKDIFKVESGYGPATKLAALNKDPKWKSLTASDLAKKPSEPEKKKPGFFGKMFGKK